MNHQASPSNSSNYVVSVQQTQKRLPLEHIPHTGGNSPGTDSDGQPTQANKRLCVGRRAKCC